MGVFTKILDKEKKFIEELYQIKILDIKNISNGILNSNFQIDCGDIKYIVRIFEADRTLDEEEQELILLNKIASFIPVSEAVKNKDNEYRLVSGIGGKLLLTFHDDFERIDKVGENDNYFAIFFFSARNEKVETLSIKNYYIIDKNTNEIYKTSEKDIIEKGIILNDVDTFLKKKGMLVYD